MKFDFQAPKLLAPIVILGSALLLTAACGDDDNAEPTKPPVVTDKDSGTEDTDENKPDSSVTPPDETDETDTDDTGGNGTDDTDDDTNDTGDNDTTAVVTEGDASAGTGDVDTEVLPDGGVVTLPPEPTPDGGETTEPVPQGCVENEEACFSCPETPEQFLKQCTEGECEPFDNEARLGRYEPGEPLPEP